MIQDILPDIYNPDYSRKDAREDDILLCYKRDGILVVHENGTARLPIISEIQSITHGINKLTSDVIYYMFSISDTSYFQVDLDKEVLERIPYYKLYEDAISEISDELKKYFFLRIHDFRNLDPIVMVFAGATGFHIWNWKKTKRFCGCCGAPTKQSETERAFICTECGYTEYPKISPAVIVAITDNDKILLAKSRNGAYRRYALISGFVEVGETFEHAVHREVLEETGLKVKNVRFYKDQPWGISSAHMIGYVAEVDGDTTIVRQESELSEAAWFKREDIPKYDNRLSVGSEMIERFRRGEL